MSAGNASTPNASEAESRVLIAGAGPTGLMLACELGLAGIAATVLERRMEPSANSRGMTIHGRTLALLAQRGLEERIKPEEKLPWPRTPFSMLWLDLEAVDESDYSYIHHQWRTERLLEERARELGVTIRRGVEVTGFEQDADGVTARLRTPDGDEDVPGAYLVGCDGADSRVRQSAGIGLTGDSPRFTGVYGDVPAGEAAAHIFDGGVYPIGLFGAMPIDPAFMRLMTVEIDRPPTGTGPVTVEELADSVERVIGKRPRISRTLWMDRFEGATRLAERYRDGRVFLAGDAAHTLFFSGTQNINAGLHDAANLGWKLAATLHGWAPDGLLDTYEAERLPVGRAICDHADAVLALMHPLENVAELRVIVNELLQYKEVSRYLLQLPARVRYALEYPGRQDGAEAHPMLGEHVPPKTGLGLGTPDGPLPVAETLHAGRAVLLDFTEGELDHDAFEGWKGRLDVVSAVSEFDASCLFLRPDGYVAFAERAGVKPDPEALLQAVGAWLGAPTARPAD